MLKAPKFVEYSQVSDSNILQDRRPEICAELTESAITNIFECAKTTFF
jgi:hypothetical protein